MIEVEVVAELTPTNPDCFGKGDNNVPDCRCRQVYQVGLLAKTVRRATLQAMRKLSREDFRKLLKTIMNEDGHDDNQGTNPEA